MKEKDSYYFIYNSMRRVIEDDDTQVETPKTKKELGQYFTIHPSLQQWVHSHIQYKNALLMEPSFGAGHLVAELVRQNPHYPMICYEIDATVKPIVTFTDAQRIIYGDFTKQVVATPIQTIIGNPPYVKTSKGNLYITFIEKCVKCLSDTGEMIMIVPSDFMKATRAATLLQEMCDAGSFTHFYFPHDETLFEEASIDVVLFRYEKGLQTNRTLVNDEEKFLLIQQGIITFHDEMPTGTPVESRFHVAVGLVSGKDEVFESASLGNMNVLVDEDRFKRFIYLDTFPSESTFVNEYMMRHKSELLERRIKTFTEANWYQWGAPRNKALMEEHMGKPCIYVRNITRNEIVAFHGTVSYFGGTLLILIPRETMTGGELDAICSQLNSEKVRNMYLYAGRFKIGHKQLSQMLLE